MDGYLNEHGRLHLGRFERFLQHLSEKEMERFDDVYSDAKWLEGKRAAKGKGGRHAVR